MTTYKLSHTAAEVDAILTAAKSVDMSAIQTQINEIDGKVSNLENMLADVETALSNI